MWKHWEEVWFSMADGKYSDYIAIKGLDEIEFFSLLAIHKKRISKQKDHGNNTKRVSGSGRN